MVLILIIVIHHLNNHLLNNKQGNKIQYLIINILNILKKYIFNLFYGKYLEILWNTTFLLEIPIKNNIFYSSSLSITNSLSINPGIIFIEYLSSNSI